MIDDLKINLDLNSAGGETKQQRLINELLRLVQTELKLGDSLPSVNQLSRRLNISRDTVFKAYTDLKQRKIIDSTPAKGYYVGQNIYKVLLVLDYYSPFKDQVYQEIKNNLDASYSIDLVFHHYNQELFDSVILNSIGRYNSYLVMNIDSIELNVSDSLKKIDPSKLLFLDIPIENWKDMAPEKYSYVWQDFNRAVYDALESIHTRIKSYKNFMFINPEQLKHPAISLMAFSQFCNKHEIKSQVIRISSTIDIQKGDAYFVIRQKDLTSILIQCKEKGFEVGKDIGILAYNDNPLYEFIGSGITVISTDFKEMGRKASLFINEGKAIREIIPTKVIIRNSL